ncbi:MAG: M14 family metallopeptidase [Pyrinomonadaceae bacterium]
MNRTRFFSIAFCLLLVISARAQTNRRLYSASTPSPNSLLGFTPGDDRKIADWKQITDYFRRLDKASAEVLVQQIGESTLKRPLIAVFISAPENILSLQKYKDIQRQLADPRTITTPVQRDRLVTAGKVVVVISCSIHSTEIVASQMSMQLAYELATARDRNTREILRNTILILIPSANPDGVDIVANWYRKTIGTPFEGRDPPELYHYYAGHDDNRDWFMLNLKETRAITRLLWQDWFPEIVYDVHQQGTNGSRFFIPPFFDPPNPNIDPLLLRQVGLIGHKMAADLESRKFKGVLTNALYDTWWHGGFRTAPYFHNSIGILSEAASARLMTPTTVTREQLERSSTRGMRSALEATTNFPDPWPGGSWRPIDILNMELIAARSLLSMASKFRTDYLRQFYELGRKQIDEQPQAEQPVAYLIPAGQAKDEAVAKLIGTLIEQGVEVFRLDRELHATYGPQILERINEPKEKLGSYRVVIPRTATLEEVPAGSYIIFLSQPQRSNIKCLFEPQIYPNRLTGQGEAERPYDVAGWTLPLQMGVDAPAVIAISEQPAERKLTRVKDVAEVRIDLALPAAGSYVSPIRNPITRPLGIAVYKSSMPNMDEGWTRYVFDTFNVPYSSVRDRDLRNVAGISQYDVVILPSQRLRDIIEGNVPGTLPFEFSGGIGELGVANLKQFVESGGTLICFDASCELPIKQFKLPLQNTLEGARASEFYCPGSIVGLNVDQTQPIARGLGPETTAYFVNSSAFETTGSGVQVVARYANENVLRSGWLLGEEKLRDKIALAEVGFGKGRVVLFAFRPQHRGQTWGTFPFIWNAINTTKYRRTP